MLKLPNKILSFTLRTIFIVKQSRKYNKMSKIADILAVTGTISIYKNADIDRYDTDNIDIGDISAIF